MSLTNPANIVKNVIPLGGSRTKGGMMTFIPRIRGRVAEGEDGKFYFFINVSLLGEREDTHENK